MTPAERLRMAAIAEQELTETFKRYLARLVAERLGSGELPDMGEQIAVYVDMATKAVMVTQYLARRMRAGEDPTATMHDPQVSAEMDLLVQHYRFGEEGRTP